MKRLIPFVALAAVVVAAGACGSPSAAKVFEPPPTTSTVPATTTTVAPTTTTTVPPTTTSAPTVAPSPAATDPSVDPESRCVTAISRYYNPAWNPPVELGDLNTVLTIGYACADQSVLLAAMSVVSNAYTPQSDVLAMVQAVCNDYPQAPLCVNG